jgi:hypothetical protein
MLGRSSQQVTRSVAAISSRAVQSLARKWCVYSALLSRKIAQIQRIQALKVLRNTLRSKGLADPAALAITSYSKTHKSGLV